MNRPMPCDHCGQLRCTTWWLERPDRNPLARAALLHRLETAMRRAFLTFLLRPPQTPHELATAIVRARVGPDAQFTIHDATLVAGELRAKVLLRVDQPIEMVTVTGTVGAAAEDRRPLPSTGPGDRDGA